MPLPILIPILGVGIVGAGAYYKFRDEIHKFFGEKVGTQPKTTPQGNTVSPAKLDPTEEAKRAVAARLGPLPPGYKTYAEWVQKMGPAVPAAHAVYDYLKKYGYDTTPEFRVRVISFQKAHNANRVQRGIGGEVPENGNYDALTSAALTLYTGDPLPGDPQYLPKTATLGQVLTNTVIGQGGTNTGTAYSAGFNVNQYIKKYGQDGGPTLAALIRQFQRDVNTDPLFPGPAYVPSPKPPVMISRLEESGVLDTETIRALKLIDPQAFPAGVSPTGTTVKAKVITETTPLRIRSTPGGTEIGSAPKGAIVAVLDWDSNPQWAQIDFNRIKGWSSKPYLQKL